MDYYCFLPIGLLLAQDINLIDTNADGVLAYEEQVAFYEEVVKDTNGDGIVSWEEERPFWKVRYEFDTWKGRECPVREEFKIKESDLPEWVADDIDNEVAWFDGKNKEELYCRFVFYNFDSGIEAQEELLKNMAGLPAGGSLMWERINIGTVSFQFVEKGAIVIYVLQDNIIVEISYVDTSLMDSTPDAMVNEHLAKAQDIARGIETLILETPIRKKK